MKMRLCLGLVAVIVAVAGKVAAAQTECVFFMCREHCPPNVEAYCEDKCETPTTDAWCEGLFWACEGDPDGEAAVYCRVDD